MSPAVKPSSVSERRVPTLPVVAVVTLLVTSSGIILAGRMRHRAGANAAALGPGDRTRRANEPENIHDQDHYVPGTPPAVAEAFLRAWMRARYDDARDLSSGALRERAERQLADVLAMRGEQAEQLRQTVTYLDATHYDLEHMTMTDLPASPAGRQRKEVRGQAHAWGSYNGTRMDSRRGQTFVLELIDGAWRVTERDWERGPDSVRNTPEPSPAAAAHAPR